MPTTVLVVDDDPDLRESLCALFEDEGYCAVGVNDGREALTYLDANLPCVILLDLMMPVMNGWEFLSLRRNDARLASIPVVVLSAVADQNPVALEGTTAQLRKPVSIESILDVVKGCCGDPN